MTGWIFTDVCIRQPNGYFVPENNAAQHVHAQNESTNIADIFRPMLELQERDEHRSPALF